MTLQTLNNVFREFTPSFFDLIIFDEVHRSIFNKWNEVVKYFDARMIGLTATPASYLDRNTFVEFGCPDNVPTFHYSYNEAVAEGLLEIDALVGYQEIVRRQFDAYITAHPFDAKQIRFLRTVQSLLAQRPRLGLADLYEQPLTSFGADAVERWFTDAERQDMLTFIDSVAREPEGVAHH